MSFTHPIHALGLTVSGDLGPFTIYTDRFGKKVFYPKAPPKSPPTELQLSVRNRFTIAQRNYMNMNSADKKTWEDLIRRSNLCMTGQNLFIHVAMQHTFIMLNTLMSQTGITVTPPCPV